MKGSSVDERDIILESKMELNQYQEVAKRILEFKEGDFFVVSLKENQSCFNVSFVYTFENEISFKYLGFKNIPVTIQNRYRCC